MFSLDRDFHLLVIDDGSPDGTGTIVKMLMGEFPGKLFMKEREGKQGLGTAYILGFRWALKRHYEYIFEMDCDFSHNPDDLLRLYDACANDGADLAVGSRYTSGGGVKNWPFSRIFISYFASVYVRLITWIPVKDTTAGFVCYSRKWEITSHHPIIIRRLLSQHLFNGLSFVLPEIENNPVIFINL